MNRLQAELCRLYLLSHFTGEGANAEESALISHEGVVRAMVLELARPADWNGLSALWQGVQADLELPAPAIAVSGIDGFQLWFSLSDPVPAVEASNFIEFLRLRYLSNIARGRIDMWPSVDASSSGNFQNTKMVPAQIDETGQWSAFIAPDLAAVFSDERWIDVCPSADAQADILSRLVSIKAADFQMLLGRLHAAANSATSPAALAVTQRGGSRSDLEPAAVKLSENSLDPKRFLQDVMNDRTVELHLRIQAAQALLPYCENPPGSAT
nr:hypothetical protein [uncultured Albidiferax sp.]